MSKTAIIGGGASGLAAAIFLKSENAQNDVTIYERMNRVGKKLLATGNGRCNLSNKKCAVTELLDGKTVLKHYFGADRTFAENALSVFGIDELRSWLYSLGMPTVFEGDKLFPYSLNAATVLDVLRLKCDYLRVNIITEKTVENITRKKGKFKICGCVYDSVIIACGGKAQEKLGSSGGGYALLQAFGHKLSPLLPSITQIKTETSIVRSLKGLKAQANLSIYIGKNLIRQEYGQILFTDYGVSGPPAFSLSRVASEQGDKCTLYIDFMPDYAENDVKMLINNIINEPFCSNLTLENLLTPIMTKRIGQAIIKSAGFRLNMSANELTKEDAARICREIKSFKLRVTGVQGFGSAQVTAGGILTKDFDKNTMQSKLINGIYAVGEVLDVDGDCGGYNLQWAFSSAFLAAKHITEASK